MEHGVLMGWVASFSYPAVLLLMVACGLGAPLSEELILITAGLVVAHGHGALGTMMAVALVGTLEGISRSTPSAGRWAPGR